MPKYGCAWLLAGLSLLSLEIVAGAVETSYLVDLAPPGLPQSSVIAMTQTRDGYLWLGTVKGLARFDGTHYEVFNEWNTPGLGGNTIVHLFEDSQGGLWVGAGNTVSRIKSGKVTPLEFPGGPAELRSSCEDAAGAVWLYLADGRLIRCRGAHVENVWLVGAPFSSSRKIIAETSGQIWIGTDSELFRLVSDVQAADFQLLLQTNALPGKLDYLLASPRGGFWEFANDRIYRGFTNARSSLVEFIPNYPWGTNSRIMTAIEDRTGHLVVGTYNGGVYRFQPDGQEHAIDGLSQNTALSLCEDRDANLWVGTDGGGLNRVKANPFRALPAGRDWVVQSTDADTNGGIWLGFNGGGAAYATGDTWKDYGPADGLFGSSENGRGNPNFAAVLVDRQQRVWVGTRDNGLFQFVEGRFQPARDPRLGGRNIAALFEDRAGNIWIGTDAGLDCWTGREWRWLNQQSGLSADRITALAEDREGNLWIGTERHGLNRWRDGKISAYRQTDGLPSDNVTSLCVDGDNVLWVGTGNGLGRFAFGRWTSFTTKDGLASDSICYLIEDEQEHLWIGSNLGLMRLAKKSLTNQAFGKTAGIVCRVYGPRDGLPTSECTQGSQPAAHRTRDGRLWFPTIRGLVTVNPADLIPNTNAPLVAVESILLDDQEQKTNRLDGAGVQKLTIPASVERLDISFTSLNLAAPNQARFSYWMEGHEAGWNNPTERRNVSYSKLPPGEYQFHVKASNEDGYWNSRGVGFSITVLPPFWKTWWFRTISILLLLGTIVGGVYFIATQKLQRQLASMRQHEALEKERARIARDLHDQLGANLTQVGLLGEMVGEDKNLPDEVAAHAQQICQTARTTSDALDEIVWAANPSNDTLDGLVTYACKYAQDYLALADLRYRLDVPTELPDVNIPPDLRHNVFLAFKESVNNVVKHAKATEVKIRLRLEPDKFVIEIEDDGRGPGEAATKTGRNGLRNMQQRMEDVGGKFAMTPGLERGTVVRLTSPISNH